MENAFTPKETVDNVKRITEKLNVKLFRYKIPFDYHIKIAKEMIVFWQKNITLCFQI